MKTQASQTLVFIDSHVADYQTLINALPADTEVVIVDTKRDGLQQMADALAGRSEIGAVHIYSHGSSGRIALGSTIVSNDNLDGYLNELKIIGNALAEDGDILLYGCSVADGGQSLIDNLARLTGADVAASDDLTGAFAMGGDWELEAHSGNVSSQTLAPENYNYLLAYTDLGTH